MRVNEECEKAGLKVSIQKLKIMASSPITSWEMCLVSQSPLTLYDSMDCSLPGSSVHGDSPGRNTGVACHAFLQGTFPTRGSNPHLPFCRWIIYLLSHQGSPRIPEWVAYHFPRGSSWPRKRTRISFIAGRLFISWATRKPLMANRLGQNANSEVIIFLASKSLRTVTATLTLKAACSLEEKWKWSCLVMSDSLQPHGL